MIKTCKATQDKLKYFFYILLALKLARIPVCNYCSSSRFPNLNTKFRMIEYVS